MLPGAVDFDVIEGRLELVAQVIAHLLEAGSFGGHLLAGDFAGFAEAYDAGDVESAGPHAALVASAVVESGNLDAGVAAANVERADALGTVEFVGGKREDVDVHGVHVDGDLAQSLHAVGVEDYAFFVAELADFGYRLDGADLVVGKHDGDQDGLVVNGPTQVFHVDEAVGLYRQIGDAVAVFFKALAGVEDGLVLGDLGDDMVAALLVHLGDALDGEVVALGRAGVEDDLPGSGADELGD